MSSYLSVRTRESELYDFFEVDICTVYNRGGIILDNWKILIREIVTISNCRYFSWQIQNITVVTSFVVELASSNDSVPACPVMGPGFNSSCWVNGSYDALKLDIPVLVIAVLVSVHQALTKSVKVT